MSSTPRMTQNQHRAICSLQRRLKIAEEGWKSSHDSLRQLIYVIKQTNFRIEGSGEALQNAIGQMFPTMEEMIHDDASPELTEDDYCYDENGERCLAPHIINMMM